LKEDADYQVFAGTNLEQAIVSSEALIPAATTSATASASASATKDETSSEMGDTDSLGDFEESSSGKETQLRMNGGESPLEQ